MVGDMERGTPGDGCSATREPATEHNKEDIHLVPRSEYTE